MHARRVVALVLGIAAAALPVRAGEEAPRFVIRGAVAAAGRGEVVAGATVRLVGPEGPLGEATTDAAGVWQVAVSALPRRVDVWTTDGEGRAAVASGTRPDARPTWDLGWTSVDLPSTVTVRLTGEGADGAEVTLAPHGLAAVIGSARTMDAGAPPTRIAPQTAGKDGLAVFDGLAARAWIATVRSGGAVRGWSVFENLPGAPHEVAVALRTSAPLVVRLTGPLGEPQAGVRLVCAPATDDVGPVLLAAATAAVTAKDGTARFDAVPAGTAVLLEDDGASLVPTAAVRTPLAGGPVVPLRRVVRVPVRGFVEDEATGTGVPGADGVLGWSRLEIPCASWTRTVSDGTFEVSLPRDGRDVGGRAACDAWLPAADPASRGSWQPGGPLEPTNRILLRLRPAELATGFVRGPGGPVAGAHVAVSGSGGLGDRWSVTGSTGPDGRFSIAVPRSAGRHTSVHHPSFAGLAVRRGGTPPDEFPLDPGRIVRGRVVDSDGRPVPRIRAGWGDVSARTAGDGRFTIRLPSDPVGRHGDPDGRRSVPPDLVIPPDRPQPRGDPVDLGDLVATAEQIAAAHAPSRLAEKPIPTGAGSATLRVEDADGRPVAGAAVGIAIQFVGARSGRRDTSGHVADRVPEIAAVSADGGTARIEGLVDGRHALTALAPGFLPAAATLDVPSTDPVVLRLAPARRLPGRVVLRSGAPVAGARVELRPSPDGLSQESALAETDAEGRYVFDAVPDAAATITVLPGIDSSHSFAPATVAFDGADPEGWTFRVREAPAIEGTVVDAEGRPAPFAVVTGRAVDGHGRVSDRSSTWADSRGRFRLLGLRPGEWALRVERRSVSAKETESRATAGSRNVVLIR